MANIRGLNNNPGNNNRANFNQPLLNQNQDEEMNLFTNPLGSTKRPDEESFYDMLSFAFQVRLKKCSIFKILLFFMIIIFSAQVIIDGISEKDIEDLEKAQFLQINLDGQFSSKLIVSGTSLKFNHEIWRLISASFLHCFFAHLLMNSFCTLILGSVIELFFSNVQILVLIAFTSFSGNMFSACWNSISSVGCGFSTSLCGMVGALLGYLIFNWRNMENAVMTRMSLCLMIVLNIIITSTYGGFVIISSKNNYEISNSAHFGGLISGIFIAMAISSVFKNSLTMNPELIRRMKVIKIVGILLSLSFTAGTIVWFYTNK